MLCAGLISNFLSISMKILLEFKLLCKEEANYQALIQLSTTPDPGHHMGKLQNTRKHHIQEKQELSPIQAGDHKVARIRQ